MFVTEENQRLYLRPLEYNMCRIMTKLAKIIEAHGGRVKPLKTALISDRDLHDNSNPIVVTHTTYIRFTLDGYVYYLQMEENPFFPFYYSKTEEKNGKYSGDAYLDEFDKTRLSNCFWQSDIQDDTIEEAANLIFEKLVSAKPSIIHRESERKRVPNVYTDGYHYETMYKPERFEKIDW